VFNLLVKVSDLETSPFHSFAPFSSPTWVEMIISNDFLEPHCRMFYAVFGSGWELGELGRH
jgi:hypothetical protein